MSNSEGRGSKLAVLSAKHTNWTKLQTGSSGHLCLAFDSRVLASQPFWQSFWPNLVVPCFLNP